METLCNTKGLLGTLLMIEPDGVRELIKRVLSVCYDDNECFVIVTFFQEFFSYKSFTLFISDFLMHYSGLRKQSDYVTDFEKINDAKPFITNNLISIFLSF